MNKCPYAKDKPCDDYKDLVTCFEECGYPVDVFDKLKNGYQLCKVDEMIDAIEHITPKATVRYGKLSIDSCLMIPIDKVIETIKEYCEVDKDADSD